MKLLWLLASHALQQVKAKLGGSVKLRAGCRAIRYRLHHKKGIEELVRRIHGEIRNSVRQKQLKLFCEKHPDGPS